MMSCSARDRSLVIHARPWRFSALRRLFAHHSVSIPVSHEPVGRMLPVHRRDAVLPRLLICVGTAGCVGILKDWLLRALQRALVSQHAALCWDDLEVTRLPDLGLLHIAEEIREFREMGGVRTVRRSSPRSGSRAPRLRRRGAPASNGLPPSLDAAHQPAIRSVWRAGRPPVLFLPREYAVRRVLTGFLRHGLSRPQSPVIGVPNRLIRPVLVLGALRRAPYFSFSALAVLWVASGMDCICLTHPSVFSVRDQFSPTIVSQDLPCSIHGVRLSTVDRARSVCVRFQNCPTVSVRHHVPCVAHRFSSFCFPFSQCSPPFILVRLFARRFFVFAASTLFPASTLFADLLGPCQSIDPCGVPFDQFDHVVECCPLSEACVLPIPSMAIQVHNAGDDCCEICFPVGSLRDYGSSAESRE